MGNTNNQITIIGRIKEEFKFSHEVCSEKFYTTTVEVPRLSGTMDLLKVLISERLMDIEYKVGDLVEVVGEFRSYNKEKNGQSHLILNVFANDIIRLRDPGSKNSNLICLNGYICKEPVFRVTPLGRKITDILLAVNRGYNKSDYIPIVVWGRNAQFAEKLSIGDNIKICGRVQSRVYQKRISETEVVDKIAYEVSAHRIEVL